MGFIVATIILGFYYALYYKTVKPKIESKKHLVYSITFVILCLICLGLIVYWNENLVCILPIIVILLESLYKILFKNKINKENK